MLATIAALAWINSPLGDSYERVWHTDATFGWGRFSLTNDLRHWINDGLMAVFFFLVGLELKRELLDGELRDPRRAALPAAAALGGMILPAVLYISLNRTGIGVNGWGIPMATDIAFVLGVLALVPRVPSGLKTFLLTLAIVDDIGAILVIAVFYSEGIHSQWLGLAVGLLVLICLVRGMNQRWRHLTTLRPVWLLSYAVLGTGVWLATLESGVHATIAGVVLAFSVRADSASREDEDHSCLDDDLPQIDDELSPAERLEHSLHPWTSFGIIPLFALANAGVALDADVFKGALRSSVTWGIVLGLVLGKLVGITAFSLVAVRLRVALLPRGVTWPQIIGAAGLAGIGFTVSLFITGLAFTQQPAVETQGKVAVLTGSLVAAALGAVVLLSSGRMASENHPRQEAEVA
ncbi:MAG: Na+/H+ antiporter NhaA [Actinomycetota bacterium]|nr:Na+/H+ antiporter NhaA [Actinomycetota bacterium]